VKTSASRWTGATTLLLLVAGSALAADQVYNFKGGVTTRAVQGITRQELEPMPGDGGFFSWTYTFMFCLDDNSSGMIQFTYWKMYIKKQRGLYFSFSDKGDKRTFRKGVYDAGEVSYTQDPPQLRMGPQSWKGFYPDFTLHLDFPADGDLPEMKADIRYHCRTPGWRPGQGPVHYGTPDGDWYDLVVMIPWADVDGTLTINGQTRAIKGFGYSDHNTQNVFPTKQTDELMALRSFSDQHSVNFLEYIAPESYGRQRTTWILVMKGDRILYATDHWEHAEFDFQTEKMHGYKYPTRITVNIQQPECRLTGEIRTQKFVEAMDALDELPSFLKPFARKFVSAPVFIRQMAEVDWHLVMPTEAIDDTFQARGIYETTIIK
jgi:hypothetical protein